MKRVFTSDLHLDASTPEVFVGFTNMLQREARRVDEIYILGDLVEMWVGDDDDSDFANSLVNTLKLASAHAKVFVQHGNRDFLFRNGFCERASVELIADPCLIDDRILLSHGDAFCTDDQPYQEVRELLRSEQWQQNLLQKPLQERQEMGRQMRLQSTQANANKSAQIMDVNAGAVAEVMRTSGASVLIHGHTHRPGDYAVRGNDSFRRIVLGDWQDCGWLCRQDGDELRLECFSLAQ